MQKVAHFRVVRYPTGTGADDALDRRHTQIGSPDKHRLSSNAVRKA